MKYLRMQRTKKKESETWRTMMARVIQVCWVWMRWWVDSLLGGIDRDRVLEGQVVQGVLLPQNTYQGRILGVDALFHRGDLLLAHGL